jgi:voltage-gated potassium channel
MSVVVIGTASFAIALGTLLGPVLQARFAKALGRMSKGDLEFFDDHVLILGDSDIVRAILDDIRGAGDVLVVSPDREAVRELGVDALTADPSDEHSLQKAGVERARTAIVATEDDAADALTILTVRQLNPDIRILAVATNRENMTKLERAGANSVISPAVIAAKQLVQSTLAPDASADPDLLRDEDGGDTA